MSADDSTATVIARDDYFDYSEPLDGVYFGQARPNAKVCCNALVIDLGGEAAAVDSHSRLSAASGVIRFAQSRGLDVGYLVNTHHHWDHSQGNAAYADMGARILAHPAAIAAMHCPGAKDFEIQQVDVRAELDEARSCWESATGSARARYRQDIADLKQYVAELPSLRRVVADHPVTDARELAGTRRSVRVVHPGPAHTNGDLVVELPEDGAVATGDCVIAWTPFMGEADPRSWIEALDRIAAVRARTIFMGHGPVTGPTWLRTFQSYLHDLLTMTEREMSTITSAEERARTVRGALADRYQREFDRHAGHHRPWATLVLRNALRVQDLLHAP